MKDFKNEANKTLDTYRDIVADIISIGSTKLTDAEFSNTLLDVYDLGTSWIGNTSGLLNYGAGARRFGMSADLAHKWAATRQFMQPMKPIWIIQYGFKIKGFANFLEDIPNRESYDNVKNILENSLPHYECSSNSETCPSKTGIIAIRQEIDDFIKNTLKEMPSLPSDALADHIVKFLNDQKSILINARDKETFYYCENAEMCCHMPFGFISGYKKELDEAINLVNAELIAKVVLSITKTAGLIMKSGGTVSCATGVGCIAGVPLFSIGQYFYWLPQIAGLGLIVADVYLHPKDLIRDVIIESPDVLTQEMSRSNFIPHPGASFIPHFFCGKF